MTVLAIDIGNDLGWALGNAVGPLEFGTFHGNGSTDLRVWLPCFNAPLQKLFTMCDAIAVEKPDTQGNSYYGVRKNMALLGKIYEIAGYYPNVRSVDEYGVSTAKKRLAGHGHADKDQMIAAARAEGYAVEDSHQADAIAILMVHHFGPRQDPPSPRSRSGKGRSIMNGDPS